MEGQFVVDDEDNSITRTHAQYREVFEKAGLELVLEQRQMDWPQELFPVMMYALRPKIYMHVAKDGDKVDEAVASTTAA